MSNSTQPQSPPLASSSSSYSPKRRDSKSLPNPSIKSPSLYYYNPEIPDSQGLGVDGRKAGQELGWAEPLIPTLSPLTGLHSRELPLGNGERQIIHEAIPSSWAYLQGGPHPNNQSTNSRSSKFKASFKKVKSLMGFNDDQDLLNHMDVTLDEIVRGKTCTPLSLNDLRTYLKNQRTSAFNSSFSISGPELDLSLLGGAPTSKKSTSTIIAPPPSASLCSNLTVSLSLNDSHPEMCERYHQTGRGFSSNSMDQEKTLIPISESTVENNSNSFSFSSESTKVNTNNNSIRDFPATKSANDAIPMNGDELDALQFLASYERYRRKFSNLTRSEKNRCPRIQNNAGEVGSKSTHSRAESTSGEVSNSNGVSSLETKDFSPSPLPLRRDLDRILNVYLSPARKFLKPKSSSNVNVSSLPPQSDYKNRRLQWLVDLGLLSEELVSTALSQSEQTTHPSILEPIYDVIYHHLSIHVLPNFLLSSTRNLSKTTRKGRLFIGLVSLALAILFTILLLLNPSPLSSNHPQTTVKRWFRILTFPLWTAGIGYCIAARTGVCVWLTLRGNHEPEEEGYSRWENHSVDGDREVSTDGEKEKSRSKKNGGRDDALKDCKPCQRANGGGYEKDNNNRCWENEEEKAEVEDASLTNNSVSSTPNSKHKSSGKLVENDLQLINGNQNPEQEHDGEEDEREDLEAEEEEGKQEKASKAWLAPELLNLLSRFHLAPKFLYGTDPNQCGLDGHCSSDDTKRNKADENRISTFSNCSSKQSKTSSIISPLPLAYSPASSPSKKITNGKVNPSSAIASSSSPTTSANKNKNDNNQQNLTLTMENLVLVSSATEEEEKKKEKLFFRGEKETKGGGEKTNFGRKSWSAIKRYTGFADKTEKVKESKVRQIQQMIALKALITTMVYSLIAVIIITAVP